ncbi:hypothetical protein L6452_11386 [Arctium lappa]|uniref:Uncharacterized protein n=1 Tax=Arctium lappa TaxID=4217 RepID=A0ACB9DPF7_ARCLA|nr:hypothetical protein L6452_11386 [Arctium lappa]
MSLCHREILKFLVVFMLIVEVVTKFVVVLVLVGSKGSTNLCIISQPSLALANSPEVGVSLFMRMQLYHPFTSFQVLDSEIAVKDGIFGRCWWSYIRWRHHHKVEKNPKSQ